MTAEWATCSANECDRPARHRRGELCSMHYMRLRRGGTTDLLGYRRGAEVANWLGDEVGYKPAHRRVVRARGRAGEHPCTHCGGEATDWAYNHEDPIPLIHDDGREYSTNPDFYIPLCKVCHRRFDVAYRTERNAWKTHCINGHEFTLENTHLRPRGGRDCRACGRERNRAKQAEVANRTVCKRGHQMTEQNTIHGRDGRRMCRTCHQLVLEARRSQAAS